MSQSSDSICLTDADSLQGFLIITDPLGIFQFASISPDGTKLGVGAWNGEGYLQIRNAEN
jgi:hypothetical protein